MLSTRHIVDFVIKLWGRNIDYRIGDSGQSRDNQVQGTATGNTAPRPLPPRGTGKRP